MASGCETALPSDMETDEFERKRWAEDMHESNELTQFGGGQLGRANMDKNSETAAAASTTAATAAAAREERQSERTGARKGAGPVGEGITVRAGVASALSWSVGGGCEVGSLGLGAAAATGAEMCPP